MIDDIYGDLDDFDMGESMKELQEKNNQLNAQIEDLTKSLQKATKDLAEVKESNIKLQHNISKLFNTAKADINRKAREITELRTKVDNLVFKRNDSGSYRIPKRKPEEQTTEELSVKKRRLSHEHDAKYSEIKENVHQSRESDDRYIKHNSALKDLYRNDNSKSRKSEHERHNTGRSRSRERKKKSPPRERHHRTKHNYSPDDVHRHYDDRKSYVKSFKKRENDRSDSESVLSINSNSSIEDNVRSGRRDSRDRKRSLKKEDTSKSKYRYSETEKRKSDKATEKKNERPVKGVDAKREQNSETAKNKLNEEVQKKKEETVKDIDNREEIYSEIEEGEISDDYKEISKIRQSCDAKNITSRTESSKQDTKNQSVLIDFEEIITKNNIEIKIDKNTANDELTKDIDTADCYINDKLDDTQAEKVNQDDNVPLSVQKQENTYNINGVDTTNDIINVDNKKNTEIILIESELKQNEDEFVNKELTALDTTKENLNTIPKPENDSQLIEKTLPPTPNNQETVPQNVPNSTSSGSVERRKPHRRRRCILTIK